MNRETRIVTVFKCARCGADHPDFQFTKFLIPILDNDETVWDWWATCPNTGDPVLMRDIPVQNQDPQEVD